MGAKFRFGRKFSPEIFYFSTHFHIYCFLDEKRGKNQKEKLQQPIFYQNQCFFEVSTEFFVLKLMFL